jgi:hypothetical protein
LLRRAGRIADGVWTSLVAAAADPGRAKSFRIRFIEVVKKMDPLHAAVQKKLAADSRVKTK